MAEENDGLTREEVEVFAHGLYYIASRDGIDASEEKLIREFLEESNRSPASRVSNRSA